MHRNNRRAAAIVELAVLLPLIMFVVLVGVDWCRIYFVAHAVQDCARNGALAASGMAYQEHGLSASERASRGTTEALRDADNFSPALQASDVTVTTAGDQVSVTVNHRFEAITDWSGIAGIWEISRTVEMPTLP